MKKLRLIEQACSWFAVRGGGVFNVRARLCLPALEWRVLAARTTHLHFSAIAPVPTTLAAAQLRPPASRQAVGHSSRT